MDGDKTEIGWIWKYWFSPEIESDQEITDDLGLIGNPESWQRRLLFVPVITTQDWKQIVQQCSQSSNFLTRFVLMPPCYPFSYTSLKYWLHNSLWFIQGGHVTQTQACDWSMLITWPEHSSLIGQYLTWLVSNSSRDSSLAIGAAVSSLSGVSCTDLNSQDPEPLESRILIEDILTVSGTELKFLIIDQSQILTNFSSCLN